LVTVAAIQMAMGSDPEENLHRAEKGVRLAADAGAGVIQLPELFSHPYFPKDEDPTFFDWATPLEESAAVLRMSSLAAELEVVLPVSFFERSGQAYFNSVAVIDADGQVLGRYRKSHIPDGPGYEEKFYFSPGDTGFKVWPTRHGRLGVGICWDQWFPEAARAMVLRGAELLCYPTAIGSEPHDLDLDSSGHWQRVMQGHAAANMVPVVAANRHGVEMGTSCAITFYGSSFIAGPTGEMLTSAPREDDAVLTATVDLDAADSMRRSWGLFRDRRPDLYGSLLGLDGTA
jgi:N-carbamoylputrescine amidase